MVFDKQWFAKYNNVLVRMARLPFIGELIFNFKKFGHYIDRKKIIAIRPNSVVEFVSWKKGYKEIEVREHFFVRNEYALRLQQVFYPIWNTFHTWDMVIANRFAPELNLGFDTLTVYPDASSGSTTVDGYVDRIVVSETYTTIIAGAGNAYNVSANYLMCATKTVDSYNPNYFQNNRRPIITFNTSSLTSDATISATTLSLCGLFIRNALGGTPSIVILSTTPNANNNLQNSDYGQFGSTSFGSILVSSLSGSAYNDFSLNSSGISNISKTGISKFGAKNSWDFGGSFDGTWAQSTSLECDFKSSDSGTNKPKLVVTYTLPSSAIFFGCNF